jgi:hypothetical protein
VSGIALVMCTLALPTGFAFGQSKCPPATAALRVNSDATGHTPAAGAYVAAGSEIPIWKTITLGGYKGANAFRDAMDKAPCPIRVGEWADEILGRPAFSFSNTRVDLDLVVISVSRLGFGKDGASLRDVYMRASGFGLELCPAEVGPVLRLNYLDQPVGEFLQVAMRPVARYSGELVDFTLGNGGAGLLLIGADARPEVILPGAARFVFVRPRPAAIMSSAPPHDSFEELARR